MSKLKIFIITFLVLTTLLSVFFTIYFNLSSLEFFNKIFSLVKDKVNLNYYNYLMLFFVIYLCVASLSLPFATILSLLIGALFNFFDAVFIITISASLGATFSFLLARYTLKEYLENRYVFQLRKLNEGLRKNGIFYLFFLRVVPIFPFFMINVFFGVTKISMLKFFLASSVGMLPGIFIYVNAGSQISNINSFKDIYDLKIVFSILILGIFPLVAKKILLYTNLIKH